MWEYFTDPVLAAPTIGCMLMSMIAAVVGALAFLQRQSLVGEMLSHACYPGVIISLLVLQLFFPFSSDSSILLATLVGAALSCVFGMYLTNLLQHRFRVSSDAALCVVLSSFFGVGLLVLSALQLSFPTLHRQLQSYLFGQAATMTQGNVYIYALLAIVIVFSLLLFYRQIKMVIFDPQFAQVVGVNIRYTQFLLISLVVLAVVIGIRTIGVVLMSAMLIFPSCSARQWTDHLLRLLLLSSLFGLVCGFCGVYFSHTMSFMWLQDGRFISFPTGPMIVLAGGAVFLFSSLFAPRSGLLLRLGRQISFWSKCQQENLLKMIWKLSEKEKRQEFSFEELKANFQVSSCRLWFLLFSLRSRGWLRRRKSKTYELTASGMYWGRKIVRLHRIWEVYLVTYCGVAKDRVHPSAEEMEHIITREIEEELSFVLHNPKLDPHKQPIPSGGCTS
ncbi:MAG: metal ABC transporter permease [Verrucomicrobia bacterium]|nr:metal ABC transporter permease [Verrucomicrobiota bacterium]